MLKRVHMSSDSLHIEAIPDYTHLVGVRVHHTLVAQQGRPHMEAHLWIGSLGTEVVRNQIDCVVVMVVYHMVNLGMEFHACFVASSRPEGGQEPQGPGHPILFDNYREFRSLDYA